MFKRFLREPLVHFLLLGGLLFYFFGTPDTSDTFADTRILVDAAKVAEMRDSWRDYWRRPPTEEELQKVIDDYVTEEVLYREARALGLDQKDPVIRGRLAHEMGLLAEDDLQPLTPDDAVLRDYMAENEETYRRSDVLSFRQLYFGPTDDADGDARAAHAMETLRTATDDTDWKALGEKIGLPSTFERLRWKEVAGLFGEDFRDRLLALPLETWSGPVTSTYGRHLVYPFEREAGYVPEFEDIRDLVQRDWETAEHLKNRETYFTELKANYDITIEMPVDEVPTVETLE